MNSATPLTVCIESLTACDEYVCAVCDTQSVTSVKRICQHKHQSQAYYNALCGRKVCRGTDGGRLHV